MFVVTTESRPASFLPPPPSGWYSPRSKVLLRGTFLLALVARLPLVTPGEGRKDQGNLEHFSISPME